MFLENPNAKCPNTQPSDFLNHESILSAFGFRAAYGISQVVEQIDRYGSSWNSMLVDINRISKAHCQYVLVRNFIVSLQNDNELNQPEKIDILNVLRLLASLFALNIMEKESSEFFMCGYLSSEQYVLLKKQIIQLLEQIRPESVSLVDAFALPDYYLHSALGRYDGKVYEAMTEMAEREPLNHTVVVKGYENYIKPAVLNGLKKIKESSDNNTIAKL